MTRRTHRIVLTCLGVACLVLVPLTLVEIAASGVGTIAFAVVVGWVVFGRYGRLRDENSKSH